MRRKSERTASKKSKASPEKKEKLEKPKHTKRRRKQSSSSASESTEEPPATVKNVETVEAKATEPPKTAKEDGSKESPDQVWQVKTSGDVGEIQKLKLCLARPPSTPERVDRSPRSKRKHARATSSSDTQSVESEDKKKSKRRSKRNTESKDVEKTDEIGDETEIEIKELSPLKSSQKEPDQSVIQSKSSIIETPMSTTSDVKIYDTEESTQLNKVVEKSTEENTSKMQEDVKHAKSSDSQTSKASINIEASKEEKASNAKDESKDTKYTKESHETETSKDTKESNETETSKDTTGSNENETLKNTKESNEAETSKDLKESNETETIKNTNKSNETETSKDTKESNEMELSKDSEEINETKTSKDSEEIKETKNSNESEELNETKNSKETEESKETEASKDGEVSKDIETSEAVKSPKDTNIQEKISENNVTISLKSDISHEEKEKITFPGRESPVRKRSLSAEKSEILELHAEESRCESSEVSFSESQDAKSKTMLDHDKEVGNFVPSEVSINVNTTEISGQPGSSNETEVEKNKNALKGRPTPPDSVHNNNKSENSQTPNGDVTNIVVNRKRRWGSRPSKLSTQKSITISTDILKEIIPDVKPVEFDEVIEEKKHKRIGIPEKIDRPVLPKIVIDNTDSAESYNKKEKKEEDKDKENVKIKETNLALTRKISIIKDNDSIIARPPSPPRNKQSSILYITNLVRPFTVPQLKNLLQRTGKIEGFCIDRIKSKCYVKYETDDQAVETRHALHRVTWPVSNPKTLHVDFSTQEDFDKAKANEDTDNAQASTIPGTVEDWLREQDMKREKVETEKPWERKAAAMREWDVGKNENTKEVSRPDKNHREERPLEKRRHRSVERSPEPARKFKKKEEEAPAKLLDDLFRKTKATPCIYWLPLSAETIAVKEEQRRQHMAEHERRLQELRRTHRRH